MNLPFDEAQVRVLRSLSVLWVDRMFVLIGASALACHLNMRWRTTRDIDLLLAVAWAEFPAGLEGLPGWSRHPKREHEWLAPGNVHLDLLPAGPDLVARGTMVWPESGAEMTLTGCGLALKHHRLLQLGEGAVLRVAEPQVIAVLKMTSWLDRPAERKRDLADLSHLLEQYIGWDDDRRYSDEVLDAEVGFDEVSAFCLGRDIAAIIEPEHRGLIEAFLTASEGALRPHGSQRWQDEEDAEARCVAALRLGLNFR